jgi:hypothetical protein
VFVESSSRRSTKVIGVGGYSDYKVNIYVGEFGTKVTSEPLTKNIPWEVKKVIPALQKQLIKCSLGQNSPSLGSRPDAQRPEAAEF